jgi:hypothetical protein
VIEGAAQSSKAIINVIIDPGLAESWKYRTIRFSATENNENFHRENRSSTPYLETSRDIFS